MKRVPRREVGPPSRVRGTSPVQRTASRTHPAATSRNGFAQASPRHGLAPGSPGLGLTPVPPAAAAGASGLPEPLKANLEAMSGLAMDEVRVHRNSSSPAAFDALAFTQGTDIHLSPGQEGALPHEAWHVVQQKQGRVTATRQMKGAGLNDDARLEREADAMGERAASQPRTGVGADGATAHSSSPAILCEGGAARRVVQLSGKGKGGSKANSGASSGSGLVNRRSGNHVFNNPFDQLLSAIDGTGFVEPYCQGTKIWLTAKRAEWERFRSDRDLVSYELQAANDPNSDMFGTTSAVIASMLGAFASAADKDEILRKIESVSYAVETLFDRSFDPEAARHLGNSRGAAEKIEAGKQMLEQEGQQAASWLVHGLHAALAALNY